MTKAHVTGAPFPFWYPGYPGSALSDSEWAEKRASRSKRRSLALGTQIGLWVICEDAPDSKYLCQCLGCGTTQLVHTGNLRKGTSRACLICALAIRGAERSIAKPLGVPQEHVDRLSNRFYAARARCNNQDHPGFVRYGARGIEMRFGSAQEYIAHIKTLPGWDDPSLEIDRIDNNGHYEAGNLRLVTEFEQSRNKRNNRTIEYRGETLVATDFWKLYAPRFCAASTVLAKAREGFSAEQIIEAQAECTGPRKTKQT